MFLFNLFRKILRRMTQLLLLSLPLLLLAAAGLVWLPTGRWLLLPIVRHIGSGLVPSLRVEGVEGSLYGGYTVTGAALVSGDAALLELRSLSVRPNWHSILSGNPWPAALELEGLSTDVESLRSLADRFGGGTASSEPLHVLPVRISVRDAAVASPWGALNLTSLDLSEQGGLVLRLALGELPLEADAAIGFSPLEVVSSDVRIGEGKGSFKGRIEQPFDLCGDLSALSLGSLLEFLPGSADLRGTGRLDGRFSVRGTVDDLEAGGVLSLTRASVRDVPLELRLPWNWSGGVLAVPDAAFRSLSADASLALSADLRTGTSGLRLAARGSAKGVSLKNIGRLLAPQAGLAGEGGQVRFDLTADASGSVSGDLSASLPEVAAGGKRLVRNLTADIRLTPGAPPRIVCDGEVFGGRVRGRGEALRRNGALRPEMSFTATELDTALMAAVFPALAAAAPSGKLALTVRVDEAMAVSGTLSSPGLTAGGVTVRDLSASLRCADGQAVLERLEGRIGKAPLSLSGTADLRRKELGFEGRVLGLDPRSIPQIASQVRGLLDVKAFVGGSFADPRVTVHLTGKNTRVADVPLRGLKLSASYADGRLTLPESALNLPGGTLNLQGAVALPKEGKPQLDLSGRLNGLNLASLPGAGKPQGLEGMLQGSFKVSGPADSAALSASLRGTGIRAGGVPMDRLELDLRGTTREIRVNRLSASLGKGTLEGKGSVSLSARNPMDRKLDVRLAVRDLSLRALLNPFVPDAPVGGILNGSLTLQGSPAKPEATLRFDTPLTIRETIVDRLALSVQSSGKNRFALHASGKLGDFGLAVKGDVRREGRGWRYSVTTDPLDLDRMLSAKSPSLKGKLAGRMTAKLTGSVGAEKDGALPPVAVSLSIPKLTASGMTVTDIALPFRVSGGKATLSGGRAVFCKGAVRADADVNLAESKWQGTARVSGLDLGDLTRPFLPEGELVGSADANVRLKGNFGTLMMVFANGSFTTGGGYLHKVEMIETISPIKRITFEMIRGTFFWDGSDLWLNPGTQATAGPGEPLYRYFSVNGPLGIPGKGLKLVCKGRFDIQLLNRVLGALKGVFQYFTGGLSNGDLLKNVVGKALGIKKRDFQDVSFVLAGGWSNLQLLNLRIDKPLKDYLPLEKLNRTEEQRGDGAQFRLNLKFPTGPGAEGGEDRTTEDQFKEQLLDNLLNIGN